MDAYDGPGSHTLWSPFWFSYMRRSPARHATEYQSLIKPLGGPLPTVEAFAAVYNFVHRPTELPPGTDLFVFRSGVQPMWEDAANSSGGRLTVRLRKAVSAMAFEETVLRMVGGTLQPRGSLCGVSVSVRPSHDVLVRTHWGSVVGGGGGGRVGAEAKGAGGGGGGTIVRSWDVRGCGRGCAVCEWPCYPWDHEEGGNGRSSRPWDLGLSSPPPTCWAPASVF